MNFPVFGDAGGNDIQGKTCAAIVENGATIWSCVDRDPLAKIAYLSLPFRLSKDPVTIDHLTLGLKLLVFMVFVVTVAGILKFFVRDDSRASATETQFRGGIATICVTLLIFCINNIPIRLTDMEAACCAAIAVFFALTALQEAMQRNIIHYRTVFLACFFGCLAGLFKQSFFAREALLILAFALCLPLPTLLNFLKNWRVYAIILLGNVGVGLQILYVWHQFGVIGLTRSLVMEQVAAARRFPYVAMEIFTLPANTAYMLSVQPDTSWLSWYVHKVYYALVTNDLFVYGGYGKPGGHLIPDSIGHWTLVYLTVIVFGALMALSIRYGSRAVRFVTLVALFNIIFMTAYQHVEPRYHILPKVLLVVIAIYWAIRGWNALPFARPKKRTSRAIPLKAAGEIVHGSTM